MSDSSKNRKQIIIVGAGAIGRGFLPWKFHKAYDFVFIDSNIELVNMLNQKKQFMTVMVQENQFKELIVPVKAAYTAEQFKASAHLDDTAAVFINVGPRNSRNAALIVEDFTCPIILCENDPEKVENILKTTKLKKVYFAVPDVITSNTSTAEVLQKDVLAVSTEDGTLFIDEKVKNELQGDYVPTSKVEMYQQWICKLFLHNTPHCVAAYLGSMLKYVYVFEAMANPKINQIVKGVMNEMIQTLKLEWNFNHTFIDWYADKELKRFSDPLLHDPISRVAREPLRKLERDGRLLGAAQLALSRGILPMNTLVGIASAILFDNRDDPDHHMSFMRSSMSIQNFLKYVLKLRTGEVLEIVLSREFEKISSIIQSIQNGE